jgi:hypothetical protein
MTDDSVHLATRIGAALALGVLAGCGPLSLGSYGLSVDADASSHVADAGPTADEDAGADASPPPECRHDPECDDADPCNGVYACHAGACVQVTPACINPDAAHCQARCDVSEGRAECVVTARDGDGDGHGDRECQGATGSADDCDDGQPAVHGGATELCDGLDNDCDGKVDLADTLPLLGENKRVGSGEFPVLASSNQSTFGAAYARSGQAIFHSFNLDGTDYLGGARVIGPLDPLSEYVVPALAWGRDSFGMVWTRNGLVRFLEVQPDGLAVHAGFENDTTKQDVNDPAEVNAEAGIVTPVGAGDWLVLYQGDSRTVLSARRITAAGEMLEPRDLLGGRFDVAMSAATLTDSASVLWKRTEGAIEQIERASAVDGLETEPVRPEQLAASSAGNSVGSPVLAVGPQGYAAAWTERGNFAGASSLYFTEIDADGEPLCSPVEVDVLRPDGRSAIVPTAMVATERGYLIVGATVLDDDFSVELLEVSTQGRCKHNQRVTIAEHTSRKAAIARAPSGEFLLLWDQPDVSGYSQIYRRSLPARLCE